jgi:hypothetical protein
MYGDCSNNTGMQVSRVRLWCIKCVPYLLRPPFAPQIPLVTSYSRVTIDTFLPERYLIRYRFSELSYSTIMKVYSKAKSWGNWPKRARIGILESFQPWNTCRKSLVLEQTFVSMGTMRHIRHAERHDIDWIHEWSVSNFQINFSGGVLCLYDVRLFEKSCIGRFV